MKFEQKSKLNDLTNHSNFMIEEMTKIISNHMALNQSTEIKTLKILVNIEKNNISSLKSLLNMNDGQIILPLFCDLLENVPDSDCQNKIVTQKVSL